MEILLVIWFVFIMRYPEYRPKRNLISYGLLAFFVALFASLPYSVNFNLSFWSNAERMLGIFHIFHFLFFYFILITVFRSWKEWQTLLFFSVIVATIISLIGLFGANPYSQIGNTAYVSGYLIFNLYFTLILFFRNKSGLRWFYLLPLIIMFFEFKNMHTSGAIIGLSLSILLVFFLIGLFHEQKKIRRTSLILFIVAVLIVIGIFSQSKSAWFQDSFLKNLTSQKITFQTRLISWRGAAADFKNHPIFGTGFGNYAIIFDKHFDPAFFNYTKSETYFDRAHNNLIDITSTAGVFGLISYLSIFFGAFYYLIIEFRKNGGRVGADYRGQKNLEIVVIIALIFAYFVQNLAIFDSFTTYMGLMIILGFVYYLTQERKMEAGEDNSFDREPWLKIGKTSTEIILLIVFLFIAYLFSYRYNVRPWNTFQGVIKGYSQIVRGDIVAGVETYQNSLTGFPLERDGRSTLINLIISNPGMLETLELTKAREILDYTISLAKLNTLDNPYDSLSQMQLAQTLDTAARFNYKNLALFNYYSTQAMQAIEYSIEASPLRVPVYLVKAQMQLQRGENEEAVNTAKYAISLNTEYSEPYCRLAQFYMYLKNEKDLGPTLDKCIDLGGVGDINSDKILSSALNYYASRGDFSRAIILAERLGQMYQDDPKILFNLAKLYLIAGQRDKAQATVDQAVKLDANLFKDGVALMRLEVPALNK
jgi:O-antigen ligase